jgi:aryl-alcohol dehydrogenase-like predicted oxidoreductase
VTKNIEGRSYLHKLGLGTVQFGLEYGVSNSVGQTTSAEVERILNFALVNDIRTIDTARTYGTSEEAIGGFNAGRSFFDIISKTIPINREIITKSDIEIVEAGLLLSLKKLRQDQLYGLLLHHADDLKAKNGQSLYNSLKRFKEAGIVAKIGVSVYNGEQIDFVLDNFEIDLIQVPMNIFDQRLIQAGALRKLNQFGVEVHVRSAFLQGLVFIRTEELPDSLKRYSPYIKEFRKVINDLGVTPACAALAFLMQRSEVNKVICGVNSLAQLKELIETVTFLPKIDPDLFAPVGAEDSSFLNPASWGNS